MAFSLTLKALRINSVEMTYCHRLSREGGNPRTCGYQRILLRIMDIHIHGDDGAPGSNMLNSYV